MVDNYNCWEGVNYDDDDGDDDDHDDDDDNDELWLLG